MTIELGAGWGQIALTEQETIDRTEEPETNDLETPEPDEENRSVVEDSSGDAPEEVTDEDAQADVVDVSSHPDARWYVVHSYSGYENKVKKNLENRIESMGMQDQIFNVVVPTEEQVELKSGQRRTAEKRIFPGYILIEMILTDDSWYVVRNTPGVTGFVGLGNKPTPLLPEEVERILKRMEAEAPTIKISFREGDAVQITDGPFKDFHGIVDSIDREKGKVRVLVSFFGRETPVELDFLQVERT
jgi:transcriptional antiterminator NusG